MAFWDSLGSTLSTVVDKASPLLEKGVDIYTQNQANDQAYKLAALEVAANQPAPAPAAIQNGIDKNMLMLGGAAGLTVLLIVLLARR